MVRIGEEIKDSSVERLRAYNPRTLLRTRKIKNIKDGIRGALSASREAIRDNPRTVLAITLAAALTAGTYTIFNFSRNDSQYAAGRDSTNVAQTAVQTPAPIVMSQDDYSAREKAIEDRVRSEVTTEFQTEKTNLQNRYRSTVDSLAEKGKKEVDQERSKLVRLYENAPDEMRKFAYAFTPLKGGRFSWKGEELSADLPLDEKLLAVHNNYKERSELGRKIPGFADRNYLPEYTSIIFTPTSNDNIVQVTYKKVNGEQGSKSWYVEVQEK